jgi:Tetracyclin repressor-like, C-terminal domain
MVAAIEGLIDAEVQAGTFSPRVPAATLAYAIVRLAEAFLYNDALAGIRGDTERLRELEAALLGIG